MTKKFVIGVLLVSFLVLINLVLAAEKSSKVPAITNSGAVSSNCDCVKKDSSLTSRAPLYMEKYCPWLCGWFCIWMGPGYCRIWQYECVKECIFWSPSIR